MFETKTHFSWYENFLKPKLTLINHGSSDAEMVGQVLNTGGMDACF